MSRTDGRAHDELREMKFTRNYVPSAAGSVLIETGDTRVIVTATIEDKVPPFLVNSGRGWVTAEYGMLPGSTNTRKIRDGRRGGQIDGRTVEIQRLIGRSLRSIVNMKALGQRTIWLDCDVIQADGGTRTAAINGAYLALYDACRTMVEQRKTRKDPLLDGIAAVSVGIVDGKVLLDLNYEEDSAAQGDFNFVMTHEGNILSVSGGCEQSPINRERFDEALTIAERGIKQIVSMQNTVLIAGG